MALPADTFILIFDALSDERREVAHALIKQKANGWWHNMPNIWIVGGQTAIYWRDELMPIISGTGANLLVMRLPEELSQREWAFSGPNAKVRTSWLMDTYFGKEEQEQPTLLD